MYGIDDAQSLHELHTWSSEVNNHLDLLKVLVGNKNDLEEDRKIFEETAVNFSLMEKIDLAVECSAKIGDNIDYIFYTIAKKLLSKELERNSQGQGKSNKASKPKQTGMVKYQGTSPSMDQLFNPPEGRSSSRMKNEETNVQLDRIRSRRNFFQRFCSIL